MATVRTIRDRLAKIDLIEIAKDTFNEVKYADQIRRQMLEGKRGDDQLIEPDYKRVNYALKKQRKNRQPPFGTPDLKDEGDFHESINASIIGDEIVGDATDEKAPGLLAKYDPNETLLTLNKQSKENYYPKWINQILKRVHEIIKGR